MALKKGEVYTCPTKNCGCEITVTKSADPAGAGDDNPICCCGMEMDLKRATAKV